MEKWRKENSGLLVFVITVTGYGMAFFYEAGYLGYYKIDWNFVKITPLQIVIGAVVALVATILYDFISTLIKSISKEYDRNNPLHRAKLEFWILNFIAAAFLILIWITSDSRDSSKSLAILVLCVYLLLLLVLFGEATIKNLKLKNWAESLRITYKARDDANEKKRLEKQSKAGLKNQSASTIKLGFNIMKDFLAPALFILVMFFCASIVGHQYNTGYKDKFVTVIKTDSGTKQIVIRDYNDTLILLNYDTDKKMRLPGFTLSDAKGKSFESTVIECTKTYKENKNKTSDVNVLQHCPQ